MRKILFTTATILFLSWANTVSAQNYLAHNSDKVRTSVDGAATDYFSLNSHKQPLADVKQSIGIVSFVANDGFKTRFIGLNYSFAYPISTIGSNKLYIAAKPSVVTTNDNGSSSPTELTYGFDVPIVAELHFGKPQSIGGLVGLGIAYNRMNSRPSDFGSLTHTALGPVAEAAIRLPVAGKACLIKVNYQLNLTKKSIGSYKMGDVWGMTLAMVF
jgi:hypothetical protein